MTTNKFLLLLVCIGFTIGVSAQNDTIKTNKNEIGLNLMPFLHMAIEAEQPEQGMGIIYKRKIGKMFLKTSINAAFENPYSMFPTSVVNTVEENNIYRTKKEIKTTRSFFETVGAEYRYKNRFNCYNTLGLDFYASQRFQNTILKENVSIIDSITNLGTAKEDYATTLIESSILMKENKQTLTYGISPSFGLLIQVQRHWAFQLKTTVFLTLSKNSVDERDFVSGKSSNLSSLSLDFNQKLLSEVSLFYTF